MAEPTTEFQVFAPPEQEAGTYANFLAVWHSPFEFTLDFCATLRPTQDDDQSPVVVPCRVVSRLKIPVTVIFAMLQEMNGIMTRYEEQFGPITRIGEDRTT